MIRTAMLVITLIAAAASAPAATIPEIAFIESRTRVTSAAYSKSDGGQQTRVNYDQDPNAGDPPGTPADLLSASVRTSVLNMRDVGPAGSMGAVATGTAFGPVTNVFVSGQVNDSIFGSGGHSLIASVEETIIGNVPAARGDLEVAYSFTLSDMFFEIWDNSFPGRGNAVLGQIRYWIELDGEYAYQMTATAGGRRLNSLISFTEVLANDPDAQSTISVTKDDGTAIGDVVRRVSFADLTETNLVLGTVDGIGPGDQKTFEVRILLEAEALFPAFEIDVGARLNAGDPNLLSGAFGTFSLETTVIPVPAAVWLFSCGVIGMIGFARRQH